MRSLLPINPAGFTRSAGREGGMQGAFPVVVAGEMVLAAGTGQAAGALWRGMVQSLGTLWRPWGT